MPANTRTEHRNPFLNTVTSFPLREMAAVALFPEGTLRFGFLMSRLRRLNRDQSTDAPRRSPIPAELDKRLRALGYV